MAASFLAVSLCVGAYIVDPAGIGGVLYLVAAAALITAIGAGPTLRGARPRYIWLVEMAAATCLLVSLASSVVVVRLGPLTFTDMVYFAGYALLVVWLLLITRHVGGLERRASLLDAATAAVGVGLAFWAAVLAPLANRTQLPVGLVNAVYPTVDVVLLALAVHLAMRLGRRLPSLDWLIGSVMIQFLLDTAYSVLRVRAPDVDLTPLMACYLFWLFGLMLAATHPSVVDLTRPAPGGGHRPGSGRGLSLIVAGLSPAVLSTAIPVQGMIDLVVRTSLVAMLFALVIRRLWQTMTALSHAEADSRHRATHDELTGLLNRAALREKLSAVLCRNTDAGLCTAVVFFDCDDFKHVNDTWGHHAGDRLLRDIAAKLPAHLRPGDVLARQGGDEFVVVSTVRGLREAVSLAEKVTDFFGQPLRILPGRHHAVTASVGLAIARADGAMTTDELLGNADLAMYEAKAGGRGRYVVFDDGLAEQSALRSAISDRLDAAMGDGVFGLELQPIMGGPGYGTVIGWEALARWHDPDLGTIPPDVFVPLAEEHGLIAELGEAVLRRACHDLAHLRRATGEEDLAIFVNVSPAQLLRSDFGDVVREALVDAGLPGRCLRLELTETLLVDKGQGVLTTLQDLRSMGVAICVDDFGTGYASLSTLLRLPIDCVKLDKSLTRRLGVESGASRQVSAVIELVASLGIDQVVAEGVETEEHERLLREVGCPMVQGWLYGRPSTFEAVLAARTPLPG